MGSSELREVDLERGMPRADQALKQGYAAVKLIHGYGSTGKGGRIRVEARALLGRMAARGEVRGVIFGEDFSIFNAPVLEAFQRCPALRRDRDLERHNNGVTIVLL